MINRKKVIYMNFEKSTFTMEFHFEDRLESNIDTINTALSQLALSNLTLEDHNGFLATVTTTNAKTGEKTIRFWHGLDNCTFRCTPATSDECFHYQFSAMIMDEGTPDCGEIWKQYHPDRIMRTLIEMRYGKTPVALVLHHERIH